MGLLETRISSLILWEELLFTSLSSSGRLFTPMISSSPQVSIPRHTQTKLSRLQLLAFRGELRVMAAILGIIREYCGRQLRYFKITNCISFAAFFQDRRRKVFLDYTPLRRSGEKQWIEEGHSKVEQELVTCPHWREPQTADERRTDHKKSRRVWGFLLSILLSSAISSPL